MEFKLGSLFDGIGGWPLAGIRQGIIPVWSSEIEQFPISVTKKHFPDMKQLGDLTKINGAEIEPVDVITFGSPCQDLSVAGKRAGLEGERSGLFMEAVRIINEMRDATNGEYPRFAVWENVPGAFSSNAGDDFRAVLEEITESKIPMPKSGKWATSGMVGGNRVEVAWRVLDAQYWGVPQRRKRIFLVADFGGCSAGEILFKPESLRGDIAESRGTREGIARGVETSIGNADFCPEQSAKTRGIGYEVEMSPTLRAGVTPAIVTNLEPITFSVGNLARGADAEPSDNGICKTLRAEMGDQHPCVVLFEPRSQDGIPRIHDGICPTLNTAQGGQRQPCIAYSIAGNIIDRKIENGSNGKGVNEEVSFTLNTIDRHAVAYTSTSFAQYAEGVGTLKASGGDIGGGSETLIKTDYKVRRLTPTECERLQGLPDDYTAGGSDTQRYKALGNGMAQPCADYVMEGIKKILLADGKTR